MTDPYDRSARPWDLINPNLPHVTKDMAKERMDICSSCEHFNSLIKVCTKCGCNMVLKTKLPNASCPVGKWGIVPRVDKNNTL
jgi:hypothetical protein